MDTIVPARSMLVLGGARSGKSRYALALTNAFPGERRFIATAQAHDEEMRLRIARHKADRNDGWQLREIPLHLADAIHSEAAPDRVLLVDCLTLWLANVMAANEDTGIATANLCEAIAQAAGPVVLVSNELGLGLVPETPLGRAFRDAQGRLNQAVADSCDTVIFVAAGQAQILKPAPQPKIVFR